MQYDRTTRVSTDFTSTVAAVRKALTDQGFGVLTEIDVTATLKAKLGHDMEDYLILGVCDPAIARQVLEADPTIGLLLPCNVIVRREGDQTVVQALDTTTMAALTGVASLEPVAKEAATRIDAVLAALG